MPKLTSLSRSARLLLLVIQRKYLRANADCWPGQAAIGAEMGISVRQVQRLLNELEGGGFLGRKKTNRTNRYWVIRGGENVAPGGDIHVAPGGDIHVAPGGDIHVAPGGDIHVAPGCDILSCGEAPPLERINSGNSSSKNGAAEFAQQNSAKVLEELRGLGMPAAGEALVVADLALAGVVAEHCRRRFGGRKPPSNPAGYLLACLRDPGKFGLENRGGVWVDLEAIGKVTARPVKTIAERAAEAAARAEAERAKAERLMAEADARRRRWEGLAEAERGEIERVVRLKFPLMAVDGWVFRTACYGLMESRG